MAIVIKDNNVEVFAISDGDLKLIKVGSEKSAEDPSKKEAIELYKMEYERCALRYDDLYKAAWTNFSYIALIAGAILTFGSDSFMTELSIFVATLPLLFWWIATFEPLNRYGDQVQARAACIEKLLNELVGIGIADQLSDQQEKELECEKGLRHFQHSEKRQFEIQWPKFLVIAFFWVALFLIAIYGFDLSKASVWVFLLVSFVSWLIWLIIQYRDAPNGLWHVFRVRFIVRLFAGILIMVAMSSGYEAHKKHEPPQNEAYIKSSRAESKLPERLTIKVEK